MALPEYKSEQEMVDDDDVVQRFEPVNAEVPDRGLVLNAEGRDFLSVYSRVLQTIEFGSTPDLLWTGTALRIDPIAGAQNLVLKYTLEDYDVAGGVQRTVTIERGDYAFGGRTIMVIPLDFSSDLVVTPLGGQAKFFSTDDDLQQYLKGQVDAGSRRDAFDAFVFARVVGGSLRLFNKVTLRTGVIVEDGYRDTEYAGDALFDALSRRVNQDRNLIWYGGGAIEWTPGTGQVISEQTPTILLPTDRTVQITNLKTGITLTPAEPLLVVSLNRVGSGSVAAQKASRAAIAETNNNVLVLAIWETGDDHLHWFEGTQYRPGDKFPLGLPSAVDGFTVSELIVPFYVYPDAATAHGDTSLDGSDRVVWISLGGGLVLRPETDASLAFSDTTEGDPAIPSVQIVANVMTVRSGISNPYGDEIVEFFESTPGTYIDTRQRSAYIDDSIRPVTGTDVLFLDDAGDPFAKIKAQRGELNQVLLDDFSTPGTVRSTVFATDSDGTIPLPHTQIASAAFVVQDGWVRVGHVSTLKIHADSGSGFGPVVVRNEDDTDYGDFWARQFVADSRFLGPEVLVETTSPAVPYVNFSQQPTGLLARFRAPLADRVELRNGADSAYANLWVESIVATVSGLIPSLVVSDLGGGGGGVEVISPGGFNFQDGWQMDSGNTAQMWGSTLRVESIDTQLNAVLVIDDLLSTNTSTLSVNQVRLTGVQHQLEAALVLPANYIQMRQIQFITAPGLYSSIDNTQLEAGVVHSRTTFRGWVRCDVDLGSDSASLIESQPGSDRGPYEPTLAVVAAAEGKRLRITFDSSMNIEVGDPCWAQLDVNDEDDPINELSARVISPGVIEVTFAQVHVLNLPLEVVIPGGSSAGTYSVTEGAGAAQSRRIALGTGTYRINVGVVSQTPADEMS